MELTFTTLILLPVALGLLGFVEPCTIGGHLLFLETQKDRLPADKIKAVTIFVGLRAAVIGLFGALIAYLGQKLIGVQTGMWLVFGSIYFIIGLAFVLGRAGLIKWRIDLAPETWKRAQNPVTLGLAFGLNIPACAAPILFGLLGLAATTGTVTAGFVMMSVFGVFLSAPLVVFAVVPRYAAWLARLAERLKGSNWILGAVLMALGVWSIWFGLYVDPANWAGI
ncbi:hypothetical protein MNBD_ALPHA09-873 [hydrothermal vent metagenome]|uniref:Uncharacterized protein n=1 Tax=hydrothermal vent metagenome TaxID=652676 RepID=A0A3B0TF30_9ZZZZ